MDGRAASRARYVSACAPVARYDDDDDDDDDDESSSKGKGSSSYSR